MSKKLKKGDSVFIITGNDKGKEGKVRLIKGDRIVVEGINIRKKHMKKTQENQKGQIIDMEMPIHISNVSVPKGQKGNK